MFEPGPGWGGKLKKWFKKYAWGGSCALCRDTRYVLIFGIVVLLLLMPQINEKKKTLPAIEDKINEMVRPKDSQTHLARRITAKYLTQNMESELTAGQKVFIETVLRETIPNKQVWAGNRIEIEVGEIKKTIEKAKTLSASQLEKWEKYAERVEF